MHANEFPGSVLMSKPSLIPVRSSAGLQDERSRLRGSTAARVLLSLLLWTAVGGIVSLADLHSGHFESSLGMRLTEFLAWGVITPLVLAFDRRLPFSGRQFGRRVSAHLAAGVLLTL